LLSGAREALFGALNESAIPVEITCFFATGDSDKFAEVRNTLLLAVLEVVDFFNAMAPPKK
jgi:hypothetical protein